MSLTGTIRELTIPLDDYPHVRDDASLRDVYAKLHASCGPAQFFRTVLVLDEKRRLVGVLGFRDLLHALLPDYLRQEARGYQGRSGDISALSLLWQEDCAEQVRNAHRIPVRQHVAPVPATLAPDDPIAKAVFLFATHSTRILPVVDGKQLLGVVRLIDVLDEVTIEVLSETGGA